MGMCCSRQLGASLPFFLSLFFQHEILWFAKQVDNQTSRPSIVLQMNSRNRRRNNGRVDETLSSRRNNGSSISLLTGIYGLLAGIGSVLLLAFNFVTIGPFHSSQIGNTNFKLEMLTLYCVINLPN